MTSSDIPNGWGCDPSKTTLDLYTTSNTISYDPNVIYGGGGGGSYNNNLTINVPPGWSTAITNNIWLNSNTAIGTGSYINWPTIVTPNAETLKAEMVECLFQKMVTTVKPGEKVVVCVDSDVTAQQAREFAESLDDNGVTGIVIRGARAGTGVKSDAVIRPEDTRVDILARLGELWEQRPDMKLTELLSWYQGQRMEDKDFAAACEVHFDKVTDGVHSKS